MFVERKMPRRNYHEELITSLKDPDMASAYLKAAIEEAENGEDGAQEALFLALRNIAEARRDADAEKLNYPQNRR